MCCHGEVWLPEEPRHLSLVSRLVRRAIWPFCMDNPSRVLPYWNSFVVGGRWSGIHTGRPMKLTAKQKDEETTTVYSKDIISVVKLPEEFTAALLFWNDVLYTTEATGGLSNIVRPMAGKPIRHLLRATGIEDGCLATINLQRSR